MEEISKELKDATAAEKERIETMKQRALQLFASSDSKKGISRYNILAFICQECMGNNIQLARYEQDELVDNIFKTVNKAMNPRELHVLDVAELLENLSTTNPAFPIMYERISDKMFNEHRWKTVRAISDKHVASLEELEFFEENKGPNVEIVEENGIKYIVEYSEYITAFGSQIIKDINGNFAIGITAHY